MASGVYLILFACSPPNSRVNARQNILFVLGNARMGDEKARRVDDALSTLVQSFLPSLPNDDLIVREKRGQKAINLARSIIEGSFLPNASSVLVLSRHIVMGALQ